MKLMTCLILLGVFVTVNGPAVASGPMASEAPTEQEWAEIEDLEAAREFAAEVRASGASILNLVKYASMLYASWWIQDELFD